MKILFSTFDSPEDFLSRLSESGGGAGRLSVPTKARYKKAEAVILEIGFPGLPNRVLVRAAATGEHDEAGNEHFGLAKGEEHKRDFLVAVASGRGKAKTLSRKHRRFPMRLPARFVVDGEEMPLRGDAETDEVSARGVFLKTQRSLPEGAHVTVVLDPCDGSTEMELTGKVVYTRKDEGDPGVGVQFDKMTSNDKKRLRQIIRGVKLSGETKVDT
jgi:Tfp pilus assembly protein PilZ